MFAPNATQQQQPAPSSYFPETQVELDSQMLQIDNKVGWKNVKLGRLLSNDLVRSYLDDYQIKALYHLAAAFEALTDASQGKYDGVFDNAAEAVLADIMFIVNIARSRQGINIRVMKGRSPLEELQKKEPFLDRFKPVPGNQNQQQQQQQPQGDGYYPNYQNQPVYR